MSALFGKQQPPPMPPPLPPAPPVDTMAPEIQKAGADVKLALGRRKGRAATILTGGALLPPESAGGPGTLLGGAAR